MITNKIKYISCSDENFINEKIKQYNYCLRFLYKKIEEIDDKKLFNYCKERFNLNTSEYRSIVVKVKQIRLNHLDKIKKIDLENEDILNDIEKLKVKSDKSKNEKRLLFKLHKKLAKNEKFLKSDIVFGSRFLLKKLSYLFNNKEENQNLITKFKLKYKQKRQSELFLMGEANQKGNRFFNFDLENKVIIYKPFKDKKIEFKLCNYKNKNFNRLQKLINNKSIPITVGFNHEHIYLTYDEKILFNYDVNKIERRKEVNEKTKGITDKNLRKKIINIVYKKYHDELRQRKFEGKISERYIAIDMNPDYLSFVIGDSKLENNDITNTNNDFNIIKSGCFNLKKINKKSNHKSNSELSLYLSNKRKHEKKEIICYLFKLIKHYKISHFVMEDLNFKSNAVNTNTKSFNRKTKNIWDINLITNLINKKCNENGVELVEVNPVYTSLIGNLSYKVFDPVGSATEILRRGMSKYIKNRSFYPVIDKSAFHTMELVTKKLQIDVETVKDKSWKELYAIFNKFRYRWDESVNLTNSLSMKSYKSKVILNEYCL